MAGIGDGDGEFTDQLALAMDIERVALIVAGFAAVERLVGGDVDDRGAMGGGGAGQGCRPAGY